MATVTVNITKGEGGFGMRISVEGVVTGYSVPGGAAEVRDGGYVLRRRRSHARPAALTLAGVGSVRHALTG